MCKWLAQNVALDRPAFQNVGFLKDEAALTKNIFPTCSCLNRILYKHTVSSTRPRASFIKLQQLLPETYSVYWSTHQQPACPNHINRW